MGHKLFPNTGTIILLLSLISATLTWSITLIILETSIRSSSLHYKSSMTFKVEKRLSFALRSLPLTAMQNLTE